MVIMFEHNRQWQCNPLNLVLSSVSADNMCTVHYLPTVMKKYSVVFLLCQLTQGIFIPCVCCHVVYR